MAFSGAGNGEDGEEDMMEVDDRGFFLYVGGCTGCVRGGGCVARGVVEVGDEAVVFVLSEMFGCNLEG